MDAEMTQFLTKLSQFSVRSIESPKYGLGLSPIDKFWNIHSPNGSPYNQKKDLLNGSLFGAANKLKNSSSLSTGEESKGDVKDLGISAYLNENSPT